MKRLATSSKSQTTVGAFSMRLPIHLHARTDLHLVRKVWHLMMGLAIAFIYLAGMSRGTAVMILGSVLGADIILEMARLRMPTFNEKCLKFWGPLMRSHERDRLSAVPHYLASTLLAIAIFPRPVAILSIMYLACGDPIASLFGILYGHKSLKLTGGKSLIGTAASVVTCTLVGFVFLKTLALPESSVIAISLIGGLVGGTAELMPFDVDDNFSIPVISGFVLWLAFIVFGL